MTRIIENEQVKIIVEIPLKTDITVKYNKPDIKIFDKKNNKIFLVEIAITLIENLRDREVEKINEYKRLCQELSMIHKCRVTVVPIVIALNSIRTLFNKKYRKLIDLSDSTISYI